MALTYDERIPHNGQLSRSTLLLSGKYGGADLVQLHQRVKGLNPNSGVQFYAIPTHYDLAQAENRLMIEWLLGNGSRDMRYNLAEVLFSDEVQGRYDRIIIDAPPRLTTAHVQALAASTHVLIPTVLDQLSGEAVGSFVEQAFLHRSLWPHLKIIGVVGSMTDRSPAFDLRDYEERGIVAIEKALEQVEDRYGLRGAPTVVLPRTGFIPQLAELGKAAGTRIGYLDDANNGATRNLRRAFDDLGQAVVQRLPYVKEWRDLIRL